MVITYTNYSKTITDGLKTILRNEFTATPGSPNMDIVLSDIFEPERLATKFEYIRFWIEEMPVESYVANGENRNYSVGLYYYFDISKKQIQRDWESLISDRIEHVKQLIFNNYSYSPSSVYIWHQASIINVSRLMTVNESDNIPVEEYENVKVIKLTITITRGNFS